jgi:hypothetical protein
MSTNGKARFSGLAADPDTKRPYRLWDAVDNIQVRWRCYAYPRNAHLGALIEARWGKPGHTIEVLDIRTGALLGQYKRTPTSVQFTHIKRTDNG